jgi:RNA polymerase sigma-70 factor (ECF subfamily)
MKVFLQNLTDLRHSAFRLANALLKNREEAEDVVQDILLKLWMLKDEMNEVENLKAYLLRMTRNNSLDKLKTKKINTISLEAMENKAYYSFSVEELQSDRYKRALVAICDLPEMQRTVLQMRDVEGISYQEISNILEMEESAVRTNLSRARKKVREALLTEERNEHREA